MEKVIREAGREPMQRDTFYRRIGSDATQVRLEAGKSRGGPRVSTQTTRIGCVPYLNARPLLEGIGYPVTERVPAQLRDLFREGS